ncbi:MAG: GTPase ObgE [Candidatus Obscuribacterales bacterium]|nr:GTPase ObgE [Candidatus Obscuribacterales bacterium]
MNQFVDQVRIKIFSGNGGNGMVAWRREKYEPLGGPAGGTGGRGGHVIFEATSDMSTLLDFRYRTEFKAFDGEKGGPKNRHGKDGKDLIIKVPAGTLILDSKSGRLIADLTLSGSRAMVAEGGRGGRGNFDMVTPSNRAPHHCEPGELGIERELELTLKMLADIGLIGLPNAGKSTLLSVLTKARPKIADYPFSTLSPNLGVIKNPEGHGYVIADIPGLISGASQGVGLGHTFLRHVERTRVLVHLADMTSPTLAEDLSVITNELLLYDKNLAKLPQIVFLNKSDLLLEEEAEAIAEEIRKNKEKIFPQAESIREIIAGSCATTGGIQQLKNLVFQYASQIPEQQELLVELDDQAAYQHPDNGFNVSRHKNIFYVSGERLERILSVTNLRSPEALQHFYHILRAMGVIDALQQEGAEPGSEVIIGKTSFSYGEEMF